METMTTIMFVEKPEDKGKMIVGFQLCSWNYYYAPKGIIRIARILTSFSPYKNRGYYADIYMKQFIRKWKKRTYENIQRRHDKKMAKNVLENIICNDISNSIIDYL
jgi:hypothetical protein